MAELAESMPPLDISTEALKAWGEKWASDFNEETKKPKEPWPLSRVASP